MKLSWTQSACACSVDSTISFASASSRNFFASGPVWHPSITRKASPRTNILFINAMITLGVMTTDALYLEDLGVGQKFTSGTYRMEEQRMKAFAAEFDPQFFHLDEDAASDSVFHGLAASGWHTAAATMRLLVDGPMKIAGGVIGFGGEI